MTRFAVVVVFGAGLILLSGCAGSATDTNVEARTASPPEVAKTTPTVPTSTPVSASPASAGPTAPGSSTSPAPPSRTPTSGTTSDPTSWQVSVDGYGPLKVGMTQARLRDIVGPTLKIEQAGAGESCLLGHSSRLPDVTLGIVDGSFTTTMVGTAAGPATGAPHTPSGIHLGMSESALRTALGPSARTQQPTSTAGTDYLLDVPSGQAEALVQSGQVTFFAEGSKAFGEDGCV